AELHEQLKAHSVLKQAISVAIEERKSTEDRLAGTRRKLDEARATRGALEAKLAAAESALRQAENGARAGPHQLQRAERQALRSAGDLAHEQLLARLRKLEQEAARRETAAVHRLDDANRDRTINEQTIRSCESEIPAIEHALGHVRSQIA